MTELAYFATFRMAVSMCKTREELVTLWREQAENRNALNMGEGTDNYRRLAEICATRNTEIGANP